MKHMRRAIQQAVPRSYKTVVGRDGRQVLVLWKMWLGRSYDVTEFAV